MSRLVLILLTTFCAVFAGGVDCLRAQSGDGAAPTPLASSEVAGQIAPREIGDARVTRHFYTFSAGPGDLTVNVEGLGLNGDVDLFLTAGLRPLTKISLYSLSADEGPTKISKSVFFRRRESVVLRVEARAASDATGSYRVAFDGPFIAADKPISVESPANAVTAATPRPGSRRVNSIGARIEDPIARPPDPTADQPRAAAPPAATTDAERRTNVRNTASTTPAASSAGVKPIVVTRERPAPVKLPRTRSSAARRRVAPPAAASADDKSAKGKMSVSVGEPPPSPPVAAASSARRSNGSAPRANSPAPRPAASAATTPPTIDARLVIETRDGGRFERSMSEVRRVTVEKGVLIVVDSDGRAEKRPMSSVLRVAIE